MLAPSIDKLADEHPEATVVKLMLMLSYIISSKIQCSVYSENGFKQAIRICLYPVLEKKRIIYEFYSVFFEGLFFFLTMCFTPYSFIYRTSFWSKS